MNWRVILAILKETLAAYGRDKASRLAAALAYYALFSLGPLLLIAISVAGLVFGQEAATGQMMGRMEQLMGRQGAEAVQTVLAATSTPSSSLLATAIGLIALIYGATGAFGQLQAALDTIWGVKPERGGFGRVLMDQLVSFLMVLSTGCLLLVSLVTSTALAALAGPLADRLDGEQAGLALQAADFTLSFAAITVVFALIYKLLPETKIAWGDVWLGAGITAFLFVVGKLAMGLYLATAGVGSAYGAAGSLVVLLVWVYYSARILFLGAEFTKVYAHRHGSRAAPVPEPAA